VESRRQTNDPCDPHPIRNLPSFSFRGRRRHFKCCTQKKRLEHFAGKCIIKLLGQQRKHWKLTELSKQGPGESGCGCLQGMKERGWKVPGAGDGRTNQGQGWQPGHPVWPTTSRHTADQDEGRSGIWRAVRATNSLTVCQPPPHPKDQNATGGIIEMHLKKLLDIFRHTT